MRRIPRPSRAIDPSHALAVSIRHRVSPWPCRSALSPCIHAHPSAAFSTTTPQSFLLPGKQDKKKHQQFVRRWQKRLLGDSEPIGAHVDPYDPTSPVRIAPEEQGEYEEVLDDEGLGSNAPFPLYEPAERSPTLRVGGDGWLKQKVETDMAKDFEKLTLRTYTPLTLEMADEIEELTGTPYTLNDENLMMAQTVHDVTSRPYTNYNFGLHTKVKNPAELRKRFTRAVAEIYALKQAGLDLDLSKLTNRGIYQTQSWVQDIKLVKTAGGQVALEFPQHKSLKEFLELVQTTPAWEEASAEEEEISVEEAEHLLDPLLPQEQQPTMDPETPVFKRAAVVKMDAEKKPFDFMSNRPVPRAKPAGESAATRNVDQDPVAEQSVAQEPVAQQKPSMAQSLSAAAANSKPTEELTPAAAAAAATSSRISIFEAQAQLLTDDFAALKKSVKQSSPAAISAAETTWRKIAIDDLDIKFALYKRLHQLTGFRIPDPQLSTAKTLGDLYGYLCDASKPRATSLFSAIHLEGQKARERAKRLTTSDATMKRRANVGDLIGLGNVELRRVKANRTEKRSKMGLEKVVGYALWERGLSQSPMPPRALERRQKKGSRKAKTVGHASAKVEFEKPISSKGTNLLAKKTREWKEEQAAGKLSV